MLQLRHWPPLTSNACWMSKQLVCRTELVATGDY
uniref:Uncharacterized protein n=1 Tax=Arundo donax TaxID=35708 RepID=A0A0A9BBD8_ARUDO